MRLISFSLYGRNPLYLKGAVINAQLAPEVYPDWTLRFYCGAEVTMATRSALESLGCQTLLMPHVPGGPATPLLAEERRTNSPFGMFWRFLAASEPENEHVIFRDCDSRLNVREKAAVDDWVRSGRLAHTMRDHDAHRAPILGGMWGIRGGILNIERLLDGWAFSGEYGDDMRFLAREIWPRIKHDALCHGREGIPFPPHPEYRGFVGEVIRV